MKRIRYILLAASVAILLVGPTVAQQTIYVNASAVGQDNGTSWVDAFVSLQDALAAASAGDEIWVASGVYRPDNGTGLTPGDRALSFDLVSGVRIHGGFAGNESSKSSRDLASNQTMLSGDLAADDDGLARRTDNSFHVVRAIDADDDTLLEGVVVVNGHADGVDEDSLGGGILISGGAPSIINTRVNSSVAKCGGGIAVSGSGIPTVVNVVVHGNGGNAGGGICNIDSNPRIVNATVTRNTGARGPGIYNRSSSPAITNSVVADNASFTEAHHCEVFQYPCSLRDVPDEIRAIASAVLDTAYLALESGTIQDAVEYLQDSPMVSQVFAESTLVVWRVLGGTMSLLIDGTDMPIDLSGVGQPGQSEDDGVSHAARNQLTSLAPAADPTLFVKKDNGRTIIGEDWNGSGKINNRDGKRALILSPFGFPDAEFANLLLGNTPGYSGSNIQFATPIHFAQDASMSLWGIWDQYDFVYLSTFGYFYCGQFPTGKNNVVKGCTTEDVSPGEIVYLIIVSTTDISSDGDNAPIGVVPGSINVPGYGRLNVSGLTTLYFLEQYVEMLDNALVFCGYCHLPDPDTSGLARYSVDLWQRFMGTNLDVTAWTRKGEPDVFATTEENFRALEKMAAGVHLKTKTAPSVLKLYIADDFQVKRIIELPVLMYAPDAASSTLAPLVDLTDITSMVEGTLDDDEADAITLRLRIYGLDEESKDDMNFRFFVGDTSSMLLDLESVSAVATSFSEFVYDVVYVFDFPFKSGLVLLKAVVELFDETESEYEVVASLNAFSCSAEHAATGYRNASFTGAANWQGSDVVTLTMESVTTVIGLGPNPDVLAGAADYQASMVLTDPVEHRPTPIQVEPDSITYTVAAASLTRRHTTTPWAFFYSENSPCDGCSGYARVDSIRGNTVYGEYSFVGEDATSSTSNPKIAEAEGTFRAVTGSSLDIESPYWQCLNEYWEAYEAIEGS